MAIATNAAAQHLSVATIEAAPGQQTDIVVSIAEATAMTSVQCIVDLPDGLTLADNSSLHGITLGDAANGHVLSVERLNSGNLLIFVYSMACDRFSNGTLLRIPVVAADECGTTQGLLYRVRTSPPNAVSYSCGDVAFSAVVEPLPTVSSGEYYLYHAESKRFLARGEHWGACATVDRYGIPFVWTAEEYSLKFIDSNVHLFETDDSNIYTDNASTGFAFEAVEGGYLLKSQKSNRYLTIVDAAFTHDIVNVTNDASAAVVWQLKSKAEHDAIVAGYVEENYMNVIKAAGLTATAGDFADYLATLIAEDKTSAIGTARFNGSAGDWTFTEVRHQDWQPAYGADFCELWQATGHYTQTITGLVAGIYKVTMQGFERAGEPAECNALGEKGYEITTATLSANGEEVNLKSWYSGKSGDNNPNNTAETVAKFNENQYMNEIYTYVGADGTLTITVNKPSHVGSNWVLFNNFTLTHYIAAPEDEVIAVSGIVLDPTEATLTEGETLYLTATVSPSNATNQTVTWSSSNTAVAVVDSNGKVIAMGEGRAAITATAGDHSAMCIVTVEKKDIAVSSITLSQNATTLTEGETLFLTATVSPNNATDQTVTWNSNDANVVTVDNNGMITAIAEGTAIITATAGDKQATCFVTVEKKKEEPGILEEGDVTSVITNPSFEASTHNCDNGTGHGNLFAPEGWQVTYTNADWGWKNFQPVTDSNGQDGNQYFEFWGDIYHTLDLSQELYNLPAGTYVLSAAMRTERADQVTNQHIYAKVGNDEFASATLGAPIDSEWNAVDAWQTLTVMFTLKNTSNVVIGATSTGRAGSAGWFQIDNFRLTYSKSISVMDITLSQDAATLTEGETLYLNATVSPSNTTDNTVTWSSSNTAVAVVDNNGKVIAMSEGRAAITATVGDKSAMCIVTVEKKDIAVSSITLSQNATTLTEGETLFLTATVSPSNATDQTVTWNSSNTNVATVDNNGKVKAIAEGYAIITATAGDKQATCTVTVNKQTIAVSKITLNQTTAKLVEGEVVLLTATVNPENATDNVVTWTTSNSKVATVDEEGVVTAISKGTAIITAKAGGKSARCVVTVEATEDTTDIENSEIKNQKSEFIYDLAGRRVMNVEGLKGMYIVNGKKVIFK